MIDANSVSVIVPTYNRAKYINECIDSLLAQTVPAHEILVIDDGSEDGTAEKLTRYGESVRYVRKDNGGKPSAVNLGVELSNGAWIWILDDDDVALPDAISARLSALARMPDAGFVYGPHYIGVDGSDGRIVRGRLNKPPEFPGDALFLEVMKSCFFHLGTTLVRREFYERLGGLDSTLVAGEDYDFQIRLARSAKAAYCSTAAFIFRQHPGIRGARAVRYAADDREKVFRKYSRAIGNKLKVELELSAYLVPSASGQMDAIQTRHALVNRMQVMGNHGCIEALFDDLSKLLSSGGSQLKPSASELLAIEKSLMLGWAYEASMLDWAGFLMRAREIRAVPGGRSALVAMTKGLLRVARSRHDPLSEKMRVVGRVLSLIV